MSAQDALPGAKSRPADAPVQPAGAASPDAAIVAAARKPWAAFAYRDFTWLWLGGVTGTVTMLLRTLVSTQWLYDETGSAAQLGILGLIQFVQMPVVVYGGALADIFDRKKLIAMTQIVAFGLLVSLTVLAGAGALLPWHIFAVTGISGVVSMLGNSARPAMVPRVVPRPMIGTAVATNTATFQIAGIVAPLLFALLYEKFGVTTSFAVASGLAGLGCITPFLILTSGLPDGSSRRRTWTSIKEGFVFIRYHRVLPGLYLLDIGVTIVSFYRMLFPIFADQLYGMGAAAVGPLISANSLGGLFGTFVVFGANRFARKGLLVLFFSAAYALLLFAFGWNKVFYLGLIIVFGLGMTDAVSMVMRQTIAQLTSPDKLLGRVSGAHSVGAMTANSLGQAEVAFMSGAVGAGPTMIIGGVVSLAVVFVIWVGVKGVRRYRYDPANPYEAHEADQPFTP